MNAIGMQLDLFAPAGRAGTRTYLATAVLDRGTGCGECGSAEIYTQRQPYKAATAAHRHVGAYCAGCGRWIRWINAGEQARIGAQGGDA